MKYFITLAISFTLLAPTTLTYAQEIGSAVKITNSVSAKSSGTTRKLGALDPVFSKEVISATANSHGEIILKDKSRIIVGSGAVVSLDNFLVSGNSVKSGTLKIAKGAFRFISSSGKKAKITVKTPLSTIGIRGTIFDVYVRDGGVTDVILFSGEVKVCTRSGNCRVVKESCDIVEVPSRNVIKNKGFLRSRNRIAENNEFDLITRQARFPAPWRAPVALCNQRAAIENNLGPGDNERSPADDVDLGHPYGEYEYGE